jgi:segregation and condensation protein B
MARLEAVLFVAREPLALRRLAQLANLTDATEARTLVSALRRRYDERGCAFQLSHVAGGYQLLSRPLFAQWLRPGRPGEQEIRLSAPALETLVVVAYRQPVLRAEIEAIRGVACGELLRQLMDRDLLRIVGRSQELGRPLAYGTTKRFLQVFGLCNLDDLPWADKLRREGEPIADASLSEKGEAGAHLTDGVEAA